MTDKSTRPPDPALAALQQCRQRNAEWFEVCMALDEDGGTARQPWPPGREAALAILDARIARAKDAMDAAAARVTATKLTTAGGAAALLHYIIEDLESDDADTSSWPVSLLFVVANSLEGMATGGSV